MKPLKVFAIIHLFAVLHAAVALLCRNLGISDELVLTMLTIVMVLLICLKHRMNAAFTASSIIIVNVIGYLLGTGCAHVIENFLSSAPAVHALSTFITTEVVGWSIVWYTKFFNRNADEASGDDYFHPARWTPRVWLLLVAVGLIFVSRLAYGELFEQFSSERVYTMVDMLLSNSLSLVILFCLNVICVRHLRRHIELRPLVKSLFLAVFVVALSLVVTLVVQMQLPFSYDDTFSWREFTQLLSITLLVEVVFYSAIFIFDYAYAARMLLRAERDKTHQAQFRYMSLKQQLNPHFLFNSLNILDCLVCEQQTEQASAYIHKLAGIYRYMLQNENELTVKLKEEMAFVEMYVDLLTVRFGEGFRVETDIPDEAMRRGVVPCSVQLLIENAIKHNAVGVGEPLLIRITADGDALTVSNTLRPKVGGVSSTRVGLNYIRQQYLDLSNRAVGVCATDAEYRVTLPLI